jgi:hypothetical protein
VCRGYYDAYGDDVNAIRVMHRLGGFHEIPAPTKEEKAEGKVSDECRA